jgi:hypothetical protein
MAAGIDRVQRPFPGAQHTTLVRPLEPVGQDAIDEHLIEICRRIGKGTKQRDVHPMGTDGLIRNRKQPIGPLGPTQSVKPREALPSSSFEQPSSVHEIGLDDADPFFAVGWPWGGGNGRVQPPPASQEDGCQGIHGV